MSSWVRRIQRQQYPSQCVHYAKDADGNHIGEPHTNPARGKFYQGRGRQLGVKNPKCKSLAARLAREAKRKAARNG